MDGKFCDDATEADCSGCDLFQPETATRHTLTFDPEWGDIYVFCAEPGMGKTDELMRLARQHAKARDRVRIEDFAGMLAQETLDRFVELARWGMARARRSSRFVLVCDNVPTLDEACASSCVAAIRKLAAAGGIILLGMLPEAVNLVEQIGEAHCIWSCDLTLDLGGADGADRRLLEETHGIPVLVSAVRKAGCAPYAELAADPSFQAPFVDLVSKTVREGMYSEERKLRLVLLLMGSGEFSEVDEVVGRIDSDLWHYLARDAPLFGIDNEHGRFQCVGTCKTAGLNVAYSALSNLCAPYPDLTVTAARALAGRGDFARASVVGTMCGTPLLRCAFILERGVEFVNVGETGSVADALAEAREEGWVGLRGIAESQAVLQALRGECVGAFQDGGASGPWGSTQRRAARLATWCLALLNGSAPLEELPAEEADGPLCAALTLHGNTFVRLMEGRVSMAYDALLDTPWRHGENTVTAALLQMDYLLCSFLMGITPERDDVLAWTSARDFLEQSDMTLIAELGDLAVETGRLMAGKRVPSARYEVVIHRAQRLGLGLLEALLLLATGLNDLCEGALTRAHVRLERSLGLFDKAGADVAAREARLLDIAVRAHLGERVDRRETLPCRGGTAALDHVTSVVAAALTTGRNAARPTGAGRWGSHRCPYDVFWLVYALVADFGALSKRIRSLMPPLWRDGVLRASSEIGSFFEEQKRAERRGNLVVVSRPKDRETPDEAEPLVEITLLGGLEVKVGGRLIPGRNLERRRSKGLLSLLAAVPGHCVKRFTIMETVWPEHDYRSAGKCVYSATSVLRAEVSSAARGASGAEVVVANKSEGTLALNSAYMACDVDTFEEKAHLILDNEGRDRLVVSLCREVEELYRGDMFVPPTDGLGIMRKRCQTLRGLFTDVMVAGTKSATNLGMRMLACRFASKAHNAEPLREDAIEAVMVAFCAAGRHMEAERLYEGYAGTLADHTRKPPSHRLREVAQELLSGAAGEAEDGQLRIDFGGSGEAADDSGELAS